MKGLPIIPIHDDSKAEHYRMLTTARPVVRQVIPSRGWRDVRGRALCWVELIFERKHFGPLVWRRVIHP